MRGTAFAIGASGPVLGTFMFVIALYGQNQRTSSEAFQAHHETSMPHNASSCAECHAHDRDIRDLMGAGDLYIAEIYDVAKSGDTQKPFGRVFYTKDKSLVFYGYYLHRQRGITETSTFQAWGRRGTDPHRDLSLGIFFQDDAQKKRWVLKSDDASDHPATRCGLRDR